MVSAIHHILNQGIVSTKAHSYYSIMGSTIYLGALLLELQSGMCTKDAQGSSPFLQQVKSSGIMTGARVLQLFACRLLTPACSERRLYKVIETLLFFAPFFVSFQSTLSSKEKIQKLGKQANIGLSTLAKLVCSVSIGLFAANYCSYQKSTAVGISCLALSIFTLYKSWGKGFIQD